MVDNDEQIEDEQLVGPMVGVDATILVGLQADTPQEEVHYRSAMARNGQPVMKPDGTPMSLAYVTARFVQERLDDVAGPTHWQSKFEDLPDGSVRCGIGILVNRGEMGHPEWVWKYDVGTRTMVEPVKGAHSDAFKRAGVHWGIARDLYDERDEEATPAVAAAVPAAVTGPIYPDSPPQPIQQQVSGVAVGGQASVQPGAAWICPLHNDVKIVPGGVSQRTGRAYNAFYACPVPGCDQKGPSVKVFAQRVQQ